MKNFEFLEHTADEKFRAFGKSLEEAFENSAIATFSVMTDLSELKGERKYEFEIEEENLESLLYSFLGELIFLRDSEEVIFKDFEVDINENSKYKLKCVAWADPFNEQISYTDVKAITYNEMKIKETKEGFIIEAVLDI